MRNTILICFVVFFLAAGPVTAEDYFASLFSEPPKVRNVSASQGFNDNLVHIYYDLTNPGPNSVCSITLKFSDDAGSTWETITDAQGDAGYLIEPGTAKYISCQAPGGVSSDECKVRISAQEIQPPFLTGQGESGLFETGQYAPRVIIHGLAAGQRNDASKLVDIYYNLSANDPNHEYYVFVQISTDGGKNFDLNAAGVSGAVGAGQKAEKAKHIVWNPIIDLGNENEPNCVVKVCVHGFSEAESEVFSIRAARGGDLWGAVYGDDGNPIQNAQVTVYDMHDVNQLPQIFPGTDSNGQFSFNKLSAGEKIIIVTNLLPSEPTFSPPVSRAATVGEDSRTFVNIVMMDLPGSLGSRSSEAGDVGAGNGGPVVEYVRGKYCGPDKHACYLDGFSLQESFEAKIDWDGHAGKEVHWITSKKTYVQPCSGELVTRTFDMGSDIGEGKLEVQAVVDEETKSDVYEVNLDVIQPPPLIDLAPAVLYIAVPTGEGFEYRMLGLSETELGAGSITPKTSIPLFGNKLMDIGMKLEKKSKDQEREEEKKGWSFGGRLSGMVDSDGRADMFSVGWDKERKKELRKGIKTKDGIKLPYVTAKPNASVGFYFYWDPEAGHWVPGGVFGLGCDFMYSTPNIPVGTLLGVPIYFRAEIDLMLASSLDVYGWIDTGPEWKAEFEFEPLGKGVLGAGKAGVACVEGYLGGGFHGGLKYPPDSPDNNPWQQPYIVMVGGMRVVLGPFSAERGMRRRWPEDDGGGMTAMTDITELSQYDEFWLLPNDYLSPDTNDLGTITLAGGTEQPYPYREGAVYPYPVPRVVRAGDDILAVWINDDVNRVQSINRTELTYAIYDGNDWSEPEAVVPGNGTADMNPQLVSLGGGKAACIWQDADIALTDSDNLEALLSHMEIAVSIYDGENWLAPSRLTYNSVLDRSPRIAASDANHMLAVWIKNNNNHAFGSESAGNFIMYSIYDDVSGWSTATPARVDSYDAAVLDTTLAYDGSKAYYAFCIDGNSPDYMDEPDIMIQEYSAGSWSTAGYTADNTIDTTPRLICDSNGDFQLYWVRAGNIRMAREPEFQFLQNNTNARSTVVVDPGASMNGEDFYPVVEPNTGKIGGSMGVEDLDLVLDKERGRMAVIWGGASEPRIDPNVFDPNEFGPGLMDPNRVDPERNDANVIDLSVFQAGYDMWICYYEPNTGIWSLPRQLTWDDAVERFISGAFDPNGNLFCVYDKTQTDYNNSEPNFLISDPNYEIEVQVKGKPERGRSDFYYMNYRMGVDLSVDVKGLDVLPPNPEPGTKAVISAKVKNVGESPASNIRMNFFCYLDPDDYIDLDDVLDPCDPNYIYFDHSNYLDPNDYIDPNNYDPNDPNYPYVGPDDPNRLILIDSISILTEPNYAPADFDFSSSVDAGDLFVLAGHWLEDCSVWGNRCDGADLYRDEMNTVNFKDFAVLAKSWECLAGPLIGGGEVAVPIYWDVPVPDVSRVPKVPKIYVVVAGSDQGDRGSDNNTAGCETMRADVTVSEMAVQRTGAGYIITSRASNEGALKASNVSIVLRGNDPNDGCDLGEMYIGEIAAGAYYDVSFTATDNTVTTNSISVVYAVVETSDDEFNEDNNIRSVQIR